MADQQFNSNLELYHSRDRFAELLTEHESRIFRLIFCMVHRLEDAEDVFQQTALTMWDKFGKFEPETDFLAWASQIARNKSLNLLASRGRQGLCFSAELMQELAQQINESDAYQELRLKALAACRSKLPEADQQLLRQCYERAGTIRNASEEIGRSPGSIYVSLRRIRQALFHCIQRRLLQEAQT